MTEHSTHQYEQSQKPDAAIDPRKPDAGSGSDDRNIEQIMKIPINVQFVMGSSRFLVEELINLSPQQVIPTGMKTDDKVDVMANGRVIARGELVVMDESSQQLGLMITSVMDRPAR